MCLLRCSDLENDLPQNAQFWSLRLSWTVFWCLLRCSALAKDWSQESQKWFFNFSCTVLKCLLRCQGEENSCLHKSQKFMLLPPKVSLFHYLNLMSNEQFLERTLLIIIVATQIKSVQGIFWEIKTSEFLVCQNFSTRKMFLFWFQMTTTSEHILTYSRNLLCLSW